MAELADFGRRLANLTEPASLRRITAKAGQAGKKSALDAAARSLGGDRAMSNLRGGRARLTAGYDHAGDTQVQINFRGPWRLAEEGRRASGQIRPKRRGGRRALRTPQGIRARSSYGPSRGLNTYTHAVNDAQREVPKAAAEQFRAEIRKVLR